MNILLKSALALFFVCGLSLMVTTYLLLDSSINTKNVVHLDTQTAVDSKALAVRIYDALTNQAELSVVSISQKEANAMIALLQRAIPQVIANTYFSNQGANLNISIELPLPQFISMKYLNIHTSILPSERGVRFDSMTIGKLTFNGNKLVMAMISLIDIYLQGNTASKIFHMVKSVKFEQKRLFLQANINNNLISPHHRESLFVKLRDELVLFGDVSSINDYYNSLVEFSRYTTGNGPDSLAVYVNYVFKLAQQKTVKLDNPFDSSAIKENQVALMALVLYFGSDKFKLLVGDFERLAAPDLKLQYRKRATVTLQHRVDLQKHFIYSAALQLFSSQYASDALGEFKEFLDAKNGGSGFSFADLLADRAGTRLAMIVTASETSAHQAQAMLSVITDEELLPDISGLKEGIDEHYFKQEYKAVNSNSYQEMLTNIDDRLKRLMFYQIGW